MMKLRVLMGVVLVMAAGLAVADEVAARVDRAVTNLTGMPARAVKKLPSLELYEVQTPGGFFYVDKEATFIVSGQAFDAKTKENLTQKATTELQKFRWEDLPLDKAIKVVRGNGARKMLTFEDPNCGYCKKIAAEFTKLNNVTIYVMPLAILSPDSEVQVTNILCAADPAKAWVSTMLSGQRAADCRDKGRIEQGKRRVEEVRALAAKYMVTGTPTMFYQVKNQRTNGGEPAEAIEARLAGK